MNLQSLFKTSKIHAKYELYGHEARVWNSVIIRQHSSDPGQIASLGEDSRICLWDMATGKLHSKFDAHLGTSVWTAEWNVQQKLLVAFDQCHFLKTTQPASNKFSLSDNWRRRRLDSNLEHESFTRNKLPPTQTSLR